VTKIADDELLADISAAYIFLNRLDGCPRSLPASTTGSIVEVCASCQEPIILPKLVGDPALTVLVNTDENLVEDDPILLDRSNSGVKVVPEVNFHKPTILEFVRVLEFTSLLIYSILNAEDTPPRLVAVFDGTIELLLNNKLLDELINLIADSDLTTRLLEVLSH